MINLTHSGPRIERAQAELNRAIAAATANSTCLMIGGGFAVYCGPSHMMNQALCLGLDGPVSNADLDSMETLLSSGGGQVKLELPSFADPSLFVQLAQRGYAITAFQQVLARSLSPTDEGGSPAGSAVNVRVATDGVLFSRVVMAGFMNEDTLADQAPDFMPAGTVDGATRLLAFVNDEPAGAATMGIADGVVTLAGTSTLPRFRGRGVQAALVRERLRLARAAGCALATTATLPGTPSFRNMLRLGFEVLYPKVELTKQNGAH